MARKHNRKSATEYSSERKKIVDFLRRLGVAVVVATALPDIRRQARAELKMDISDFRFNTAMRDFLSSAKATARDTPPPIDSKAHAKQTLLDRIARLEERLDGLGRVEQKVDQVLEQLIQG